MGGRERQTLIAGAMSWPPPIFGGVGFHMFQGPLGNEKLEAEGGNGWRKGKQGGRAECRR